MRRIERVLKPLTPDWQKLKGEEKIAMSRGLPVAVTTPMAQQMRMVEAVPLMIEKYEGHRRLAVAGTVLVAAFALGAPIFIWVDWVFFYAGTPVVEEVAHTHELERNIWLAVTAVLVALFKLKWSSGE
jgi:hypothetical protein